jgi:YD repeat-containing protein
MTYAYAEDKLQRVEMVVKDNHGKVVLHNWSKFGYDAQGNITLATNSEGSKVKLSYNRAGQISVLRDDRIHEVSIRYDRLCGKPGIVTLKGIGAIQVMYKDDCEIDKVDSKHTPMVAMRVSSMFNNLLEVTAPANQDVYEAADSVFSSTEGRAVECQNCQISHVSPVER